MSAICVVQARTGSTRLPGKVLADLAGRPMLQFLLDRINGVIPVDTIVVATSDTPNDDAVVAVAERAGVAAVRGPEQDVLSRFTVALDAHPAEHVVRVTADCPLVDPSLVAATLERHIEQGADFTCNVIPRTFPKGLDVEVARSEALRQAASEATDPAEREHVMPFLYRRPERFRLANIRTDELLGDERWVVDTAEDLAVVRDIVARLPERFGWRDVLATVGRRFAPAPDEIHLRPATAADQALLLTLRNDPDAVRFSRSRRQVDKDEHAEWLRRRLHDPATRIWLGTRAGDPIGMVRVDVEGGIGTVSIAVDRRHRGQGLGTALLCRLVADLADDQQIVGFVASVRSDNTASRRAFAHVGFQPTVREGSFEQYAMSKGAR
jgi:spore coat polysaccharide biosynthesis protein SpsF